jgi:hypothetical protein
MYTYIYTYIYIYIFTCHLIFSNSIPKDKHLISSATWKVGLPKRLPISINLREKDRIKENYMEGIHICMYIYGYTYMYL